MIFKRIFINHMRSSYTWLYQIFASSLLVQTKAPLYIKCNNGRRKTYSL